MGPSVWMWSLVLLLGLAVLVVSGWAVATDRPATAGMTVSMGAGLVALGIVMFFRRDRS